MFPGFYLTCTVPDDVHPTAQVGWLTLADWAVR